MAFTLAERLARARALHAQPDLDLPAAAVPDVNAGSYVINTKNDGSIRVTVTNPDGDSLSGNGATLADAITALEAKL